MKIIKSAKVFVTNEYESITQLAVRTSDGRWVYYGMNSEASISNVRRIYRGRAARAAAAFSGQLWLDGGSRLIHYNRWRDIRHTPMRDFWAGRT